MAEHRRLEHQLGAGGGDQPAAEEGAVAVDGLPGQRRVAAGGDDQQRQPGRGQPQHRGRQEEPAGGRGAVPEVALRVVVDHHRAEHPGDARQGHAPAEPPSEPGPGGGIAGNRGRPGGGSARAARRFRPRPRGIGHGQRREHPEGQDLAAEPRVPQPQDGPVGVAGAAQVQHADAEGQQPEHQGAGAVGRPDAGRQPPGDERLQQPFHQERPHRELGQREHHDQRPVGRLGPHRAVVGRQHVARQDPRGPVRRRRQGQARLRRPRHEQARLRLFDHLLDVDHADGDGAVRARLHARRRLALREPAGAHVALAHDPLGAAVLRRLVGARQRAVPAPEALVVEMPDDAGHRVLLVRLHRARVHAGRIEAVVAGGRDVLDDGQTPAPAVQQADVAPRLVLLQAVQRMARRDARLAAGAGVEVDFEGVLLAGGGRRRGHEGRVAPAGGRPLRVRRVVGAREAVGGGQLLFPQVAVDERRRRLGGGGHLGHSAPAAGAAAGSASRPRTGAGFR